MAMELLPAEILCLILENISSTTNLYDLISASPACLGVFQDYSDQILRRVFPRSVSPESLRHNMVIGALPPPDASCELESNAHYAALREHLGQYYADTPVDPEAAPVTVVSRPLKGYARVSAKLHVLIRRYVRCYARETLRLLHAPEEYAAVAAIVSPAEQARLERAFYRYELYCRMFPPGPREGQPPFYREVIQVTKFIRGMSPWEAEELTCVYQFLVSGLCDVALQVEGEIISKVHASQTERLRFDNNMTFADFASRPASRMTWFRIGIRPHLRNQMRDVAHHGLQALETILLEKNIPPKARWDVIRGLHGNEVNVFEHALLWASLVAISLIGIDGGFGEDGSYQPARHVGLDRVRGTLMRYARTNGRSYLRFKDDGINTTLPHWAVKRLGYLFWDRHRMQCPVVVLNLERAAAMGDSEIRAAFDHARRPSAEEAWSRIKLPVYLLDQLEKEYGRTSQGASLAHV